MRRKVDPDPQRWSQSIFLVCFRLNFDHIPSLQGEEEKEGHEAEAEHARLFHNKRVREY